MLYAYLLLNLSDLAIKYPVLVFHPSCNNFWIENILDNSECYQQRSYQCHSKTIAKDKQRYKQTRNHNDLSTALRPSSFSCFVKVTAHDTSSEKRLHKDEIHGCILRQKLDAWRKRQFYCPFSVLIVPNIFFNFINGISNRLFYFSSKCSDVFCMGTTFPTSGI